MEEALAQQPSSCIRVVLVGPESTGKTTMARLLAEALTTTWAPEYMREYLQEKWDRERRKCEVEDLIPIAKGQMAAENAAALKAKDVVFCDTNLLVLKVYSEFYYEGFCPEEILQAVETNQYDLYFLTGTDVPWVADDLRDHPNERSTLFCTFEEELQRLNQRYLKLHGSIEERMQTALNTLDQLKKDLDAQ